MDANKKTILAIDDATVNLMTIKGLLQNDFDVRIAKSGEIGLFLLGSVKVDLILLDIEMEGMSGFDFIEITKTLPECGNIPIILVSSHASPKLIDRAGKLGVRDYIVKPINAVVLRKKVFDSLGIPFSYEI